MSAWRESRDPRWTQDIGYQLQDALARHQYEYPSRGSKPGDPGWHACSCGWEGYWSDFHPHLADELRVLVTGSGEATCGPISEAAVRAALKYILGVPDFPDFLYAPDEASAELTADVDNRNMAQMRKALEAARQAQVGFLVQEPP